MALYSHFFEAPSPHTKIHNGLCIQNSNASHPTQFQNSYHTQFLQLTLHSRSEWNNIFAQVGQKVFSTIQQYQLQVCCVPGYFFSSDSNHSYDFYHLLLSFPAHVVSSCTHGDAQASVPEKIVAAVVDYNPLWDTAPLVLACPQKWSEYCFDDW